ncbi:hypothetical protein HDV00_008351 [Rhizophlyctis rosea]|nr:hypothetical protein HDV00_008351 [Rhizophlyctis rosea]
MSSIHLLPLIILIAILGRVKWESPQRTLHLARVCKAWRLAFFKTDPGATLEGFHNAQDYDIALRDPVRRGNLRSLKLTAHPTDPTFEVVLPCIDVSILESLDLSDLTNDNGHALTTVATVLQSAQAPLRLKNFKISANASQPSTVPTFQRILNALYRSPLQNLSLHLNYSWGHPARETLHLQRVYLDLTSLHLTDCIEVNGLDKAPKLTTLNIIDDVPTGEDGHSLWAARDFSSIGSALRTVIWNGDYFAAALITFPANTLSNLHTLDITMFHGDGLPTALQTLLPLLRSLRTLRAQYRHLQPGNGLTVASLKNALKYNCPDLSSLEIHSENYDPNDVREIIRTRTNLRRFFITTDERRRMYGVKEIRRRARADIWFGVRGSWARHEFFEE